MKQAEVCKPDPQKWFDTEERCAILEVANDSADPDVSIALARVMPGVTTAWHKLENIAERYVIIAGTGEAQVGDDLNTPVQSGDVVRIPAGVRQRIRNTGDSPLIFYAICSPRFVPEAYIALE